MDLLLRKLAQGNMYVSQGGAGRAQGELHNHLDPDELNAFAENALPEAARTRFASHLADCDGCRKLATELTMASPVTPGVLPESVRASTFMSSAGQVLAGLFSLPVLRFGVPALAILLLAIVAFVALRRPERGDFVAQIDPRGNTQEQERPSAVVAPESSADKAVPSTSKQPGEQTFSSAPSASPLAGEKKASKETDLDRSYAGAANTVSTQPGFAPEPKADANERAEKSQNAPVAAAAKPVSAENYKLADRDQADSVARKSIDGLVVQKDEQLGKRNRDVGPSPPPKTGALMSENKAKGPQRSREQSESEGRSAGSARSQRTDVSSETRKVSGRTFRLQGNTWIDTAFNSSMAVTSLPRGSEQYRSFTEDDSGLRAIGQQLGNVIVVWKGKAYRIH